jgi:hypothetical protein
MAMTLGQSRMVGTLWFALVAGGCNAGRDVEVSGELTAPSSLSVGGALLIDFIDGLEEGSMGERPNAQRTRLSGLGEFKETVSLEGDQVLIRALDDQDGDGRCSVGEAWGQVYAPIEKDRAAGVRLMLAAQPCPPLDE